MGCARCAGRWQCVAARDDAPASGLSVSTREDDVDLWFHGVEKTVPRRFQTSSVLELTEIAPIAPGQTHPQGQIWPFSPHIACVLAQCRGVPICGAQASKPSVESAIRDAVIGTKFSRTPRLTEMIRLLAGAIMIRSGTPGEVHLVVLLHSSRGISRSC